MILKQKKYYNTLRVPCQKSKIISFAFPIMENIVVCPVCFRFLVKLICCILSDQDPVLVVYLNLLELTSNFLENKDNLVKNQLCNHLLELS